MAHRWGESVPGADGTDRSPEVGDAPELRRLAAERCTAEGVIEAIRSYLTGPFEDEGLTPLAAFSSTYRFFLQPSSEFWPTWEIHDDGGFAGWRALAT
jgi:hypothetical protein